MNFSNLDTRRFIVQEPEKKKRGGKREGSGRKGFLKEPTIISCSFEREYIAEIEASGKPVLQFIRDAVEEKLERER